MYLELGSKKEVNVLVKDKKFLFKVISQIQNP